MANEAWSRSHPDTQRATLRTQLGTDGQARNVAESLENAAKTPPNLEPGLYYVLLAVGLKVLAAFGP